MTALLCKMVLLQHVSDAEVRDELPKTTRFFFGKRYGLGHRPNVNNLLFGRAASADAAHSAANREREKFVELSSRPTISSGRQYSFAVL